MTFILETDRFLIEEDQGVVKYAENQMKDDGVQFKYSMKVMRVFYFKDTEQDGLRQIRINMKKADG